MASFLASLGSIAVSLLMKLIGYEFIAKVLIVSFKAWADTTETTYDDEIIRSAAKAWGVEYGDVKKVVLKGENV